MHWRDCGIKSNYLPSSSSSSLSVSQLVLRDNAIVEVPKELGKCVKLKTLHLQGNQIMALPVEFGQSPPQPPTSHTHTTPLSLPLNTACPIGQGL